MNENITYEWNKFEFKKLYFEKYLIYIAMQWILFCALKYYYDYNIDSKMGI